MKKSKKLFLMLGVILFSIILTSCNKSERFIFKEGKYEYSGEEFTFYNDVIIKDISISFTLEENSENKDNIVINRKNNLSYYVEFCISNQDDEEFQCSFVPLPRVGDQVDRYRIELDVSDLIDAENSILTMVVEIKNSQYNYSEDKENNIEADKIYLAAKNFKINGDYTTEYTFPYRLLLEYNTEE